MRHVPPPSVSLQDWLPLSAVRGSVLQRRDGRSARVLEVGSTHLGLKSRAERKRLVREETEIYNALRFPLQRLTLPIPLDLSDYLHGLRARALQDPDRHRGTVLLDKHDHVDSLITERHLVQWRNLLVIPWDGRPDAEAQDKLLAERAHQVRFALEHRLGLRVTELGGLDIARLWYSVLHPSGSASPRSVVGAEELADPDVLLDRLAPVAGLDFSHPRYFRLGRRFARVVMVTGYPRRATLAHFSDLYHLDRRIIACQHLHPTQGVELQRTISNSIGEMQGLLAGGPISEWEREATQARLRDARRLLRKLAGENHAVLDFCLFLLLTADNLEELETLTRTAITRLEGKGMRGRALQYQQQKAGFLTVLPAGANHLREGARNLPAEAISVTFPYTQADLSHGDGVVLGINKLTNNLVIIDPWALMNPHSIYIATSGAGKTFTLNELLIQFWSQGILIRQIDIEGDKGRLCRELRGQRVRLAPHAGAVINPMEVRRPPLDPSVADGDGDAEEPANGLAAAIQRQLILFSLMVPGISQVELARAETLLIGCYQQHGIHFESEFAGIPPNGWPTWRHLWEMLGRDPATQNLAAVMQSWVNGSLRGMLDGPTNVELDNQYVMVDLHDVMGHRLARAPIFFLATTFLWDEINRDWRQKKILDIDELGVLADNEDALEFIWRLSKTARRRRCRLQVATQDPADFLMARSDACRKYAQGLINNCATKVLGYLEEHALDQVQRVVRLSEAERDLLSRLPREEKLVLCSDTRGGQQRAHLEVVASDAELRILDPDQYARRLGGEGP